jgi:hypothetical protein
MAKVTGSSANELLTRVKDILELADKKLMELYGSIEASATEAVRPQIKFEAEDSLDVEAADLLALAGQATWITAPGKTGKFLVHVASESPGNAQNAARTNLLLAKKVEELSRVVGQLEERLERAEAAQLEAPKDDKALPEKASTP